MGKHDNKQEKGRDDGFESLMRKFKRNVRNTGDLRRLRDKEFFEKPSDKRKKVMKAAQRRTYLQQEEDKL
ncbi:MAG: 30S ribosomal protein S21 [bacterium]|nr:30S ribosomal protein S21 [bacterium]